MTMPEASADSVRARETRRIWLTIVVATVVWVLTIFAFGLPAVTFGGLVLTALVFLVMLMLMRGK